jgi:hypothetical protein
LRSYTLIGSRVNLTIKRVWWTKWRRWRTKECILWFSSLGVLLVYCL